MSQSFRVKTLQFVVSDGSDVDKATEVFMRYLSHRILFTVCIHKLVTINSVAEVVKTLDNFRAVRNS